MFRDIQDYSTLKERISGVLGRSWLLLSLKITATQPQTAKLSAAVKHKSCLFCGLGRAVVHERSYVLWPTLNKRLWRLLCFDYKSMSIACKTVFFKIGSPQFLLENGCGKENKGIDVSVA